MAIRRLLKDDTVMVIAGRERGKTGKVLRVFPERSRVLIVRVNMVNRHVKPRGVQQPGGIQEKEASIHLSNVLTICGRCNKPTRVDYDCIPSAVFSAQTSRLPAASACRASDCTVNCVSVALILCFSPIFFSSMIQNGIQPTQIGMPTFSGSAAKL